MKILVITQMFPSKRHPTSAIFFSNLLKELAPKVDELIVINPRVYIPKVLTKLNKAWKKWYIDPIVSNENKIQIFRPHVLSLPHVSYAGINGILMQYSLYNFLKNLKRKKKIDIILAYNMLPEGIAAVRLAKMYKLPVGFWAIGSDVNTFSKYNWINYFLSKKCIENSDLVLTESKDLENTIRIIYQKHNNVKTFYKGIDFSNFVNLPAKNEILKILNLDHKKRYILFVGRLIREKGIYEIAESFNILTKRYVDLNLILLGENLEKKELISKFQEAGTLNSVLFTGIVPYKKIAFFMKISELLIFPSWAEGLPNVVMEAMASGLPVITSDVGGIPEVLINEVTGLSVPAKNVEKLTEAAIRMIEDKELRENCIKSASKLIYENFNVKKNVYQLYNILEELKNANNK